MIYDLWFRRCANIQHNDNRNDDDVDDNANGKMPSPSLPTILKNHDQHYVATCVYVAAKVIANDYDVVLLITLNVGDVEDA